MVSTVAAAAYDMWIREIVVYCIVFGHLLFASCFQRGSRIKIKTFSGSEHIVGAVLVVCV